MSKIKTFAEKNRIMLQVYAISFLIFVSVYGLFFKDYFTPDHIYSAVYGHMTAKPGPLWWYFMGGRPVSFFIAWINYGFINLGFTNTNNSWMYQLVNFLIMSGIVVTVYSVFERFISDSKHINYVLFALVMFIFVNPMYMENVVFRGYDLAIGVLFAALSAKRFTENNYISSLILLYLSVCTYQNFFEFFMVIVTVFLLISVKRKGSRKFIGSYMGMAFVAVAALFLNIISQKLVIFIRNKLLVLEYTSKAKEQGVTLDPASVYQVAEEKQYSQIGAGSIIDVFKPALCSVKAVFKNVSYPSCFFEIAAAVICLLILVIMIKNKEKISEVIVTGLVLFALSFYYIVIYLAGVTDYAGRILWPFYACVSGVMIYFYSLLLSEKKQYKQVFSVVILCMAVILIRFCNLYQTDFFINQSLDRQIIGCVEAEIERYENESGNKVTTIYTREYDDTEYVSKYLIGRYNFEGYSYNGKNFTVPWSDVELLIWLSGREYEEIALTDEEYNRLFDGKTWTEFNASEQMIFNGNTLYWAKY